MTQQVSVTPTIEQQEELKCRHHWVIQPADGPVSQGKCQICGESREFKNYVEASTWGDDKGANRSKVEVAPAVSRSTEDDEEE